LLDAGEQALFARLAVFVGGCTLQAVEMICGMVDEHLIDSSTAEGTAVWEGLMSLVDQSMVRRAEQINGEPRFEMLETIREYASERLTDRGEIEHLRERHAKYYLGLAEQIEPELQSAQQVSWLEQLDLEHGNLRAALEWALEHGATDVALRLGAALWRFWLIRGHLSEGARSLEAALMYKNSVSASVRARALHGAGILMHYRGDYTGAIAPHEESLALRRALGDRQGIAKSLNSLGLIARDQHDYARAQIYLEESLVLLRELGDKPNIAALLNNLGLVAHQLGDDERAAALYEESLALCLLNLGHVALQQKQAERATSLYQESMTLYQELADKRSIAECLEGLADVARAQGHLLSAVRWCGGADALREMTGAPRWPDDQARYDRVMNAARAHLDESTLEACRSEGLILPLEQVIVAASNWKCTTANL
jgi:tetratricopeptide (TPR) repeat protein